MVGGGGGGGSGGSGGGGGAPPLRRTRSLTEGDPPQKQAVPSAQEQRRSAVGSQIKQRYQQIEEAKRSRQMLQLSTSQLPGGKRKAPASASAQGGGLRKKLG